jgi:CBS domain-containing protein
MARIEERMSRHVVTVSDDATLEQAAQMMRGRWPPAGSPAVHADSANPARGHDRIEGQEVRAIRSYPYSASVLVRM